MRDDLSDILRSIKTTQGNIINRLAELERNVVAAGTSELTVPGRWGYCSPTTPPSQRIAVRGGRHTFYDTSAHIVWVGSWPDFNPLLSISAFTDAYYYRSVVAYMSVDSWDPADYFDVNERSTFPTYEEAVADLERDLHLEFALTSDYPIIPLCAIIVRNNGTTGVTDQYLPVTLNDRSQSSFAIRDMRPWIFAGKP